MPTSGSGDQSPIGSGWCRFARRTSRTAMLDRPHIGQRPRAGPIAASLEPLGDRFFADSPPPTTRRQLRRLEIARANRAHHRLLAQFHALGYLLHRENLQLVHDVSFPRHRDPDLQRQSERFRPRQPNDEQGRCAVQARAALAWLRGFVRLRRWVINFLNPSCVPGEQTSFDREGLRRIGRSHANPHTRRRRVSHRHGSKVLACERRVVRTNDRLTTPRSSISASVARRLVTRSRTPVERQDRSTARQLGPPGRLLPS